MRTRFWSVLRPYAIPGIALLGLLAGGFTGLGLHRADVADDIWRIALVLGGLPLVWTTLRGLLRGQFAADVVAMLAIVTAVAMDEPFAGLVVVLMQSGGGALEQYALQRASSSLEGLLARAPRQAWRQTGDRLEEIDVVAVQPGDRLVVRPGALIPVDGTLTAGDAEVDESTITGEPLAGHKQPGDLLLSGSVNTGGAFEMRADRPSSQSQYARIVALVQQAQSDKPPISRLADRYAVWFTPLTLLMSGLGWWITGNADTILAVLVVATPCPLILATPIAVISGINRAARAGIIVKGGAAIEQVGRATAVVFDKTGTLTLGSPLVDRVVAFDGIPAADLLRKVGSVEQLSSHLLGRVLVAAAQEQAGPWPVPTHFQEIAGRGVEGDLEGEHIMVGSPRFLSERIGAGQIDEDDLCTRAHADGALAAFVAIDQRTRGVVLFRDRMRPGVPELVTRLRALGVRRTVMLTGDRADNARAIAAESGIDQVEADLLPQDKVTILEQLKRQYDPIVMVGDGINDAPALATATVGIAMGAHGTGISAEAADIVLLVDDVSRVGDAVAIGQHTLRIARQSIFVGLGLSFLLMCVASVGLIPAPVGALCQEVVDVAVILNALRAR